MTDQAHSADHAKADPLAQWQDQEAALIDMLDNLERQHGYIPRKVSDQIARLLEVKLERLKKIKTKVRSTTRQEIEPLLRRWKPEEGNLIMVLHAIQNQHGYVPREVAMELSRDLDVPLARIYEVITFYHYFKLQPPGKHNISLCNGTACYIKGGQSVLQEIKNQIKVKEGETTEDRQFHLDVVRCIGCCGMAPAMVVDGKTYGKLKPGDVPDILAEVRKSDAAQPAHA